MAPKVFKTGAAALVAFAVVTVISSLSTQTAVYEPQSTIPPAAHAVKPQLVGVGQ